MKISETGPELVYLVLPTCPRQVDQRAALFGSRFQGFLRVPDSGVVFSSGPVDCASRQGRGSEAQG